jgi:hypothetical protein
MPDPNSNSIFGSVRQPVGEPCATWVWLPFAAATLLVCAGCYLPIFNGPPGTIGMQRSRAVLFDPFPSDTLGPPIMGGRPRGFDLPLADVTSAQSNPNARPPSRGF